MRATVAGLVCLLALLGSAGPADAAWTGLGGTLNVDANRNAGPPKVADIGGVPSVTWNELDPGTNRVQTRVARLDGSSFTAVGGSLNENSNEHATATSIASVGGEAWVATSELLSGNAKVRVKRWNGTAWVIVGAVFPEVTGDSPTITAVGGTAYVAYLVYDGSTFNVRVRRWNGSQWELVGSGPDLNALESDGSPTIADVAGVPYVVYQTVESGRQVVRVSRWNGTAWMAVGGNVSTSSQNQAAPSLVDMNGSAAIAWIEMGSSDAFTTHVARWDGAGWVALGTPLPSGDDPFASGIATSLTVAAGRPYVSVINYGSSGSAFTVSNWNGSRWTQVAAPLNRGNGSYAGVPAIAAVAGSPVVAWRESAMISSPTQVFASRLDIGATIEFSAAAYSVSESSGNATVTVRRTGSSAGPAVVDFAFTNGTATPSDYGPATGTLSFADGQSEQSLLVPIIEDETVEPDETVNLVLSAPGGDAVLGPAANSVLTINNDDVIDTVWVSAPEEGPISDTNPPFIFSAVPSEGATFECRRDGGEWGVCTSPFQPEWSQGPHTLSVRALTADGRPDATPLTRAFTVDTVRPGASISVSGTRAGDGYAGTVSVTGSGSDEAPSSGIRETRCVIDPPEVPLTASSIRGGCPASTAAPGSHTAYVAAVDNAGNAGIPVSATFVVHPTPETTIASGPEGNTYSLAAFTFTSSVAGSTFECRLVDEAFEPCTSPRAYPGLERRQWRFEVRAVSPLGVRDVSPAVRDFKLTRRAGDTVTCSYLIEWQLGGNEFCFGFVPAPRCPAGSRCTTTVEVSVKDKDGGGRENIAAGYASFGYGEGRSGYAQAQGPRAVIGSATCHSNPHPLRRAEQSCPRSVTLSYLGGGERANAYCSTGSYSQSIFERPIRGPDDARRVTCKASFTVEPITPLDLVAAGTDLSTYLAGPGALLITPGAGRGKVTAAGRRRAPALFATARIRVKKAGVTPIRLKLSRSAKRTLDKRRRLTLTVNIAYTPTGGRTTRRTQRFTITKPARCSKPPKGTRVRGRCR